MLIGSNAGFASLCVRSNVHPSGANGLLTGRLKSRDIAGVDIAGVDTARVIGSRKSMCAQKNLSYTLSRPMCCSYFWQMRHKTKALM